MNVCLQSFVMKSLISFLILLSRVKAAKIRSDKDILVSVFLHFSMFALFYSQSLADFACDLLDIG